MKKAFKHRLWGLWAGAVLCGLGACAPSRGDAYLQSFSAGERAMHAGRFEESARHFDEAAESALRVKDRDEARFLQGRVLERAGNWKGARKAYEKILLEEGPRTGRASFEVARIELEHGNADKGRAMLMDALKRYPAHGLAANAVKTLALEAEDKGGEEGRLSWLKKNAQAFQGTPLEQLFEYEIALSLERLNRNTEARDAFIASAERHPYPFGNFTDDALWHAALIEEKAGRHQEAIALLQKLLSPREVSTQMGSYERPRFSAAQMKIAEIYRDGLKDKEAALRAFRKLYADHPTSVLRDDAMWAEATMLREDKKADEACGVARRLAKQMPESRYARCVQAFCPSEAPAKKPCPDYILRELLHPSDKNKDSESEDETPE